MSQTKIFSDQITDPIVPLTGATGTVAHDLKLGSVFHHSSVSANFTANITNVPTTNNRTVVVVLVIEQGLTAYLPTALQINGTSQSINWINGSAPTGTASKKEIVAFTLIRTGDAWAALGTFSTFG